VPDGADEQRPHDRVHVGAVGQVRVEPQAGEDAGGGDDQKQSRIDARHQPADDGEDEELDPAAEQEHVADVERAVMHDGAAIQRQEERPGEDGGADEEVEQRRRRIGAVGEYAQIDHRVLRLELVADEADDRDRGDDGERRDGRALEPAVAIALLEHVLQRDHADGEQRDAEAVDGAAIGDESRLLDLRPGDPGGEQAERHVDEEDEVPARDVDQIAADRRTEQRAGDGADAEERAGHAVLALGVALTIEMSRNAISPANMVPAVMSALLPRSGVASSAGAVIALGCAR
jgi:hypothetical protein